MKTNETYTARGTIRTVNGDDQAIDLERGARYVAESFDQIVNVATGEVIKLPLHIARHPDWYFNHGMATSPPKVTHEEYIRELVRGTEGLLGNCYWDMGLMEGWFPCENPVASNASFTATLSKLGFVMRKDGEVVKGIKHGARDCTYHTK